MKYKKGQINIEIDREMKKKYRNIDSLSIMEKKYVFGRVHDVFEESFSAAFDFGSNSVDDPP